MDGKFLKMRKVVKQDEYSINKSDLAQHIWQEQLHNQNGRNLNFKEQQQEICDLVNNLNNKVKEYDLFIYWLRINGFVTDTILDTFQNILAYDNPMLRLIDKEIRNEEKALDIYRALQQFSGGV